MGSKDKKKKKFNQAPISCRSSVLIWIALASISALLLGQGIAGADTLEYLSPWSVGFETMFSWIDGQIGFDQTSTGFGTLNNLRSDLGLPQENQTYRIYATMRPLEHHMIKVFGNIPEVYKSQNLLGRELRLTELPAATGNVTTAQRVLVFPADSIVKSEMRTAQFGFGYDLDFIVGPGHAAGLQGELRYIDLRITLSDKDAYAVPDPNGGATWIGYQNNLISLDELTPCLGAHAQAVLPLGFSKIFPQMTLGGYTRMNFGLWPGYLNYVDIQAGLQLVTCPTACDRRFLAAKFGFEHESIFHDGAGRAGRVLELKRDGLTCSLEAIF